MAKFERVSTATKRFKMASRRRLNYSLVLVLVLTCTSVGTLVLLRWKLSEQHHAHAITITKPAGTGAVVSAGSNRRHVTKSLSELRGAAPVPELSGHVLFFNRVPKAGSEMLVLLLQWLQGANGFRHVRLGGGARRRLVRAEQEVLVQEVSRIVRKEAVPVTFDKHVYFINFTEFDRQSPTFFNLVRDPVDKAASRFYYGRATPDPRNPDLFGAPKRSALRFNTGSFDQCVKSGDSECTFRSGQAYDLTIPYFCGNEEWCMLLNNQQALERAKANVERYFPVVGVLEELNTTLAVLESHIPYFFKGVQQLYFQELMEPHKNRNRKRPQGVTPGIRKHLQSTLEMEYEFYNWLRARLLHQESQKKT